MDPITMMLLASGLGAVGNIGGGLLSSLLNGDSNVDPNEFPMTSVNAYSDPLLAALYGDLLAQLGQANPQSATVAGPVQQILAGLNGAGRLPEEDAGDVRGALAMVDNVIKANPDANPAELAAYIDDTMRAQFGKNGWRVFYDYAHYLNQAGYGSTADLVAKSQKYNVDAADTAARLEALRPTTLAGREAAIKNIAQIQQDYPLYTKSEIRNVADIERQRSKEAVLQAANVGGFNPAAGIAEVERDPQPYSRALSLLGAEQTLSNNALSALAASLLDPQKMALASSQLALGTAVNNASLAAQQAASVYGRTNQNTAGSDIGTGFAAGIGSLGGGLQSLALMDLFKQAGEQPGTGSGPAAWGSKEDPSMDWLPEWLRS